MSSPTPLGSNVSSVFISNRHIASGGTSAPQRDIRRLREPAGCLRRISAKIRKVERRSKRQLDYAETEYLRRQPKYEKSGAEASVSLIMPRRSIFGIGQRYEKVGRRSKRQLDSTETEYLRRSQRYEKVGRESKFLCILPGASIRGVSQRRMSRRQKQARSQFCPESVSAALPE